jgi:hypothetical protein
MSRIFQKSLPSGSVNFPNFNNFGSTASFHKWAGIKMARDI